MHDFLNLLGNNLNNALGNIDHSVHDKIKGSVVDNFIHELRDYLFKSDSMYKLSQMPKDTIFEINEIEKDYIQCYLNHQEFPIPKNIVCMSELKDSEIGFIRITIKK